MAKSKVSREDLEAVNDELRKAVGSDEDEDGGSKEGGSTTNRILKSLDKAIDTLGKAVIGSRLTRPVEQVEEKEVEEGAGTGKGKSEGEATLKRKTYKTQAARDEELESEVGAKSRYGANSGRYVHKSEDGVETEIELVEDEEGNVVGQDAEGNLYEVEEVAEDEGEAEVVKGGAGSRFLDRIDESEDFVEVAEGSEALAHLTKSLAETLDELEAGLHGHLMAIEEGQQTVFDALKVQSQAMKSLLEGDTLQKSLPVHGGKGIRYAVLPGGKREPILSNESGSGDAKVDQRDMLRKAVQEGKLPANALEKYAAAEARGVNGLLAIPDTILKAAGIEVEFSDDELRKAQDIGL